MRKFAIASVITIIASLTSCVNINAQEIKFKNKVSSVETKLVNDKTFVGVREFGEILGLVIDYRHDSKEITIKNLKLKVGSVDGLLGEEKVTLDTAPIIIGDKCYLPLRTMIERLDYSVKHTNELIYIDELIRVDYIKEKEKLDNVYNECIKRFDEMVDILSNSASNLDDIKESVDSVMDRLIKPIAFNDLTSIEELVPFYKSSVQLDKYYINIYNTMLLGYSVADARATYINYISTFKEEYVRAIEIINNGMGDNTNEQE